MRYGFANAIARSSVKRTHRVSRTLSDKIDAVVLNRMLGIPIFLAVMYVMFLFAINFASAFIDFFDVLTGTLLVDWPSQALTSIGAPGWLIAVLPQGVGAGIQTVSTFIPVIGFLFLFLTFLEDSGYMARAAFVMDRSMRAIGLPGKSFIPMVLGFGCSVPAVMATRTLDNRRDRIMTVMMAPFMSCGARLPVYALFAAAFFPMGGQNVVFALYLIGILAAVATGLLLKNTLLRGPVSPFIMELPPYHVPTFKSLIRTTWDRLKAFVFKAGKVIIAVVVVLGFLNSLGTDGSFGNDDTDASVLSAIGRSMTPVVEPMGIHEDNWPATVGLFTGIFAKEAVVGTLNALYGQIAEDEAAGDEGEEPFSVAAGIGEAFASIPANLADAAASLADPLGLGVGDIADQAVAAEEQGVSTGIFGAHGSAFRWPRRRLCLSSGHPALYALCRGNGSDLARKRNPLDAVCGGLDNWPCLRISRTGLSARDICRPPHGLKPVGCHNPWPFCHRHLCHAPSVRSESRFSRQFTWRNGLRNAGHASLGYTQSYGPERNRLYPGTLQPLRHRPRSGGGHHVRSPTQGGRSSAIRRAAGLRHGRMRLRLRLFIGCAKER